MSFPRLRTFYFREARFWLRMFRAERKPYQFEEFRAARKVANILPKAPVVLSGQISVWRTNRATAHQHKQQQER